METTACTACDELVAFRAALHGCFGRRRDALFELVEGLLTAGVGEGAASVAHLSLAPGHTRRWGSAYAALRRGEVDGEALRALLVRHVALLDAGPPEFAVDVSVWPRRDASTSPERGFCYFPGGARRLPIIEGWAYQWVARLGVLGATRSSWTAPVDARRIRPDETPVRAAAAQIRALCPPLGTRPAALWDTPLFTFDAGYDSATLSVALAEEPEVPVSLLVRVRRHRCFYPGGPRGLRARGAPKFSCADPATWPRPVATLRRVDPEYGRVDVRAWSGMRALVRRPPRPEYRGRGRGTGGKTRGRRQVATGTILRVQVQRLPRRTSRRAPEPLWLWWRGPGCDAPTPALLDRCWRAYARRFDLEQTFRFLKQRLGWTTPRVRLPEQADRWTWLVTAAFAHLLLARRAVADQRLPWERPLPPDRLTPSRVLRAFVAFTHRLPRVAAPPRPCGRSPGRPKGRRSRPAPRYPPIPKAA